MRYHRPCGLCWLGVYDFGLNIVTSIKVQSTTLGVAHATQRENTPTLSKYGIECLAQKNAVRDTPLMSHNNTPAVIVVVLIIQLEQFPFSA